MTDAWRGEYGYSYLDIDVHGVYTDGTSVEASIGDDPKAVAKYATGRYRVVLSPEETADEGDVVVDWEYTLDGVLHNYQDIVTVITPYASRRQLESVCDQGPTLQEIRDAEVFARHVINSYTNNRFGRYEDTVMGIGRGDGKLTLFDRCLRIDSITTSDGRYELEDYDFSVATQARMTIHAYAAGEDYLASEAFHDGQSYAVTGEFGWNHVPDAISRAAVLLSKDYFCKDGAWTAKYVDAIQSAGVSFDFAPTKWSGTGNFYVDKILDDYVILPLMVI